MCKGLEEVCLCLRLFGFNALDADDIHLERLGLCVIEPCTERTDTALELGEVSCDLILGVATHTAEKPCGALKGRNIGALYAGEVSKLVGNFGEVGCFHYNMGNRFGHDFKEVVVTVGVGGRARQLHNRKVCVVDNVQRLAHLTDDIAHGTEGCFKLDYVFDTRLEVKLDIGILHDLLALGIGPVGTEAESLALPVGAVIESQLVCLAERNAVVVAVLALGNALSAVNGKDTGGVHTIVDVLHEAGNDGVHTGVIYRELVAHPLTGGLPLIAAYGVKNGAGGIGGTCHRRCTVFDGVNGGGGGTVGDLSLDLYLVGSLFGIFVLFKVLGVCGQLFNGEKSDRLYSHRLVDRFKSYCVFARFKYEFKRIGIKTVNVAQLICTPFGSLHHFIAKLVAVNIGFERTCCAAAHIFVCCAADYFLIVHGPPHL